MTLATEIVKFFLLNPGPPAQRVRTIDDFANSRPEWYHELEMRDVLRICSTLEREGYLFEATSRHDHPILGRTFCSFDFEERRAAYGEYEFAAHDFEKVRKHFEDSVLRLLLKIMTAALT